MRKDIDDFGLDEPAARIGEKPGVYKAGEYSTNGRDSWKGKRRVKQKGDISGPTNRAKELYLYGNGDGKPIRNVTILAEKSGSNPRTLERWIPVWKRESDEMARRASGGKLALVPGVTDEVIAWQRKAVDSLKLEIDKLQDLMAKLTPGTDVHQQVTKQFALLLAKWETSSGYADHVQTAVTAQRELLKQAARLQGKDAIEKSERQANSFNFS